MYKLSSTRSPRGNNKCKVMKINPNVITVWAKKILNLQFFIVSLRPNLQIKHELWHKKMFLRRS